MANKVTCKVEGVRDFLSNLKRYQKQIAKDVDTSLNVASKNIAMEAKGNCIIPSIAGTIQQSKVGDQYQVTTQGEESAYLEFGTGNFAKALLGPYPEDWKNMARKFYINGLGRTLAKPYLYPAFQKNAGEAVHEIIDKVEGY